MTNELQLCVERVSSIMNEKFPLDFCQFPCTYVESLQHGFFVYFLNNTET